MSESVILAGACTPSGDLFAGLGALSSVTLGALIIEGALDRAGICAADVDYVITGQEQARQAAQRACIPDRVPAISVSRTRLSGLNVIALADQLIRGGQRDVVVVGGVDLGDDARLAQGTLSRRRPEGAVLDAMVGGSVARRDIAAHFGPTAAPGLPRRADCAVAIVLMRRAKAERLGLPWLAGVGAHSTVVTSAGSSYAQAVRAIRQALREVPATPKDLRLVEVRKTLLANGMDRTPVPLSAAGHAFDTTGMRMVLRLAQALKRRGRGMGAASMWGDHPAEAVIVCSHAF
jgi:acetyl-CoA acetyltransferase